MRDNFYKDITFFGFKEYVQLPIFIIVVFLIAFLYKNFQLSRKHSQSGLISVQDNQRMFKYFYYGLLIKLIGVFIFTFIYLEFYGYGDTVAYFESSHAIANVFYEDPVKYLDVLFGKANESTLSTHFDNYTWRPYRFMYLDTRTCMVLRLTSPIVLIAGGSMLITGLLIACLSFWASWKVYEMLCEMYPRYIDKLFIPVLMMPSVAFWATGVLKDSYCYIGMCLILYGFYSSFIRRPRVWRRVIYIVIGVFLIISIKPFILFGLLPACLIWYYHRRLMSIRGFFLKVMMVPLIIAAFFSILVVFFTFFGDVFAKFGVDEALSTAAVTHNDLKKDHYGGQAVDIGDFDGSPQRALQLFPAAVLLGIYRPFIFEAGSPMMLITAIENLYLMILLLLCIWQTPNPFRLLRLISKEPVVLSFLVFSILFAFLIGLSTSNFGALVRFKVPLIPLYASAMIILRLRLKEIKAVKRAKSLYEKHVA